MCLLRKTENGEKSEIFLGGLNEKPKRKELT